MRKIIHIDMDAFYASIEQRDNPDYFGKALAVGYAGPRGVVAAASYEARRYGVRSAMSSKVAMKRCPHLIFVSSRFDVYREVSKQIMSIFHEYTNLVEPLSLDEAFLDVTENYKGISSATQIAQEIKRKIFEQTKLTASAGISFNKFLAKIASDYNKPNGLFLIRPKDAERFVETLPIEQFFGIGKVTAEHMHRLGIKNGLDLRMRSEQELVTHFGNFGHMYYQNARGIDDRSVEPYRVRKSLGSETTFEDDTDSYERLRSEIAIIAREVIQRVTVKKFKGRTVTLKVKYADFRVISRSKTLLHFIDEYNTLYKIGSELLSSIDIRPKVRLIGLNIKNNNEINSSQAVQLRINFDATDNN